jgi:hypothetical protein
MSDGPWSNQLVSLLIISASGAFTGLFMYTPAPGAGNLVASITPNSGTDPFGNAYPAGITEGLVNKIQATLFADPVTGIGRLRYLLHSGNWTNPEIVAGITGSPNFADIGVIGPASTAVGFTDNLTMAFNSSDAVSSSANISTFYNSPASGTFTYLTIDASGVGIRACSQLTATQPGTGTPGTPAQSETWHSLGTLAGYTVNTGRYRMLSTGEPQLEIDVTALGANGASVAFSNALPSGYRPAADTRRSLAGSMTNTIWPNVLVTASTGAVTVGQNSANAFRIYGYVTYPLS